MRVYTDFDAAFADGTVFEARDGRKLVACVREVGTLAIEGGRIAFGDPRDAARARILERRIPPGRYTVEASTATSEGYEEPAALRVRLGRARVERWEMALAVGENVETLAPAEMFATYVGSGARAVLLDADALPELEAQVEPPLPPEFATDVKKRVAWRLEHPPQRPALEALERAYEAAETNVTCLALPSGAGVAVFATPGPGAFAAYWGITAEGELADLVIDLNGFLENDYVDFAFEFPATPGPLALPLEARGAGEAKLVERAEAVIVEVTPGERATLELRGHLQCSRSSETAPTRYFFGADTRTARAVAHFGLRRMALSRRPR